MVLNVVWTLTLHYILVWDAQGTWYFSWLELPIPCFIENYCNIRSRGDVDVHFHGPLWLPCLVQENVSCISQIRRLLPAPEWVSGFNTSAQVALISRGPVRKCVPWRLAVSIGWPCGNTCGRHLQGAYHSMWTDQTQKKDEKKYSLNRTWQNKLKSVPSGLCQRRLWRWVSPRLAQASQLHKHLSLTESKLGNWKSHWNAALRG